MYQSIAQSDKSSHLLLGAFINAKIATYLP